MGEIGAAELPRERKKEGQTESVNYCFYVFLGNGGGRGIANSASHSRMVIIARTVSWKLPITQTPLHFVANDLLTGLFWKSLTSVDSCVWQRK